MQYLHPLVKGLSLLIILLPVALGQTCGDGVCLPGAPFYETSSSCARDCNPVCGDGTCVFEGTTPVWELFSNGTTTCPKDCKPTCGDGVCAWTTSYSARETTSSCPSDCAPTCGDGICAVAPNGGTGAESASNCAKDCAPTCGDGVCAIVPLSPYTKENAAACPQDCAPVCGNGLCEGLETCLTCPMDCGCKFNGGLVTLYRCAPGNITLSSCIKSNSSQSLPAFVNSGTGIPFITVHYTSYLKPSTKFSGNFMFLINGTNVGARLFINDKKLIDAYFPQDNILTTAKALLPSNLIHKLELQFYSISTSAPRNVNLLWRDLNDPSSTFTTVNETYYSVNNCGDHIFDSYETTLNCSKDFTGCHLASCQNSTDCGDGICLEQSPEDCFIDCHPFITTQCSSIGAKPGFLSQNLPVEADTLGDLIRNQMLWHLPGLEHMQYGMNIVTGEAAGAPLFYFGYCSENIGETIQDTYRGNLYTLPSEIYAQPSPKCQYSAEATSYSSSVKMANSFAQKSGLDVSANANGGFDGITAGASFAYSQEKSVKQSRQMEQKDSGSLIITELICATSKVQMTKYTFHPNFLAELAKVNTSDDVVAMIDKYGTHFYQQAVLGGKLRQVTSVSKSYSSSKTKSELEQNSQLSFGASVTSPVFSVSGDFSDSIDTSVSASEQQSFESSSTHSTVITYGGPPGSFGPSSSEAPTNFGDWASSVDLLPVPIDYTLKKISEIIPSLWKSINGSSLQDLWKQGETIWKQKHTIFREGATLNHYTLYWFWDYDNIFNYRGDFHERPATEYFVFNATLSNGTMESTTLMDQLGPQGSYITFKFYTTVWPKNFNPAKFDIYTPFNLTGATMNITSINSLPIPKNVSLGIVVVTGIERSYMQLQDWQTGLTTNFDNQQFTVNHWYYCENRDIDPLTVSKFYFELTALNGGLAVNGNNQSYYEIIVYHSLGKRAFQFDVYDSNIPTNLTTSVFFQTYGSPSANAFGYPYKVSLRIGSRRDLVSGPATFSLSNFWVQGNYCPGGPGVTGCNANTERQRQVFSMEPASTLELTNYDKAPLSFDVKRLNEWV